jgi:hypothetical protein
VKSSEHYKSMQEGIVRASHIRKDLSKHTTEYYPEKVRGLNKAYMQTVKEIIRQGNFYLDNDPDFWLGLEVAQIIENYNAFLSALKHKGETDE